ncbi:MAG TPA: hypothetical protein VIX73_21980 [Kofleriaceae bacterium]|jgi:hypothetical protein
MDEILEQGRKRDRRNEIVLGVILIAGGLAFTLGMRELTGGGLRIGSLGATGLGVGLLVHGLIRR